MRDIVEESDTLRIRRACEADLDFVISAEQEAENSKFIGQWTKERHVDSLSDKDIMHLVVEESNSHRMVGYVIMAGLSNPNHSIEFRRIVITEKGKGYGRETLRLIKKIAFEKLEVHRLWLDVRYKNGRAQNLYKSEGFVEEGILRECILHEGKYESLIVMSILRDEYKG